MRRILFTLIASGALLAFAPSAAMARHHHSARHHARHHSRHHARVRIERFGSATPTTQSSGGGDQTGAGQPGQGNAGNAGTVASFQNGILTIALNDGSMVSGRVTSDTEIACEASDSSSTTMQRDDQGSDHGGRGDNNDRAGNNDNDDQPGNNDNDENNEQEEAAQNCSSANLTMTTPVRAAELKITSAGATWDKVELVASQTGSDENEANENEANENEANDS